MKNPLLLIVKLSKFVTIKPDYVDDVKVTRFIVNHNDIPKLSNTIFILMRLMDAFSGFYGYRYTISFEDKEN